MSSMMTSHSEDKTDRQHHEIKSWPDYFTSLRNGRRKFEVRLADRDYQGGDRLTVKEWDPKKGEYTGQKYETFIWGVYRGLPGVDPAYVVLAIG